MQLPAIWGNGPGLSIMRALDLSANSFTGQIPTEWGGGSGLSSKLLNDGFGKSACIGLLLSDNLLEGTIFNNTSWYAIRNSCSLPMALGRGAFHVLHVFALECFALHHI